MTKEEIRIKWIQCGALLKLDACVDNAMDEYAKIIATGFAEWLALSDYKYHDDTNEGHFGRIRRLKQLGQLPIYMDRILNYLKYKKGSLLG